MGGHPPKHIFFVHLFLFVLRNKKKYFFLGWGRIFFRGGGGSGEVKCNYRGKHTDTLCPVCGGAEDTQQHVLVCPGLDQDNEVLHETPKCDDIFTGEVKKQALIVRILKKRYERRISLTKST